MKDTITNPNHACINIMYFLTNYPSNFIKRCWENDQNLVLHLQSKFDNQKQLVGVNPISQFFGNLDRENQEKLVEWITHNYKASADLKVAVELPKKPLQESKLIDIICSEYNFPNEFIVECWTYENISNDFQKTFDKIARESKTKQDAFVKFYNLLSEENKQILLEWIDENYFSEGH